MSDPLRPEAERLHAAFVAAFPVYLAARLGAAAGGIAEAVAAGGRWLDEELRGLISQPYRSQRRSPLELFQEAMRFPTAALRAAGAPPADRDAAQRAALPGDDYHLAPASSQDLGEEAWEAHLAWGAAKARAFAAATVLYVGADLMDRTRIAAAAQAAGLDLVVARPAAVDPAGALRAFVDLTAPDADDAIRALAGAGVRTVAFGPHVDDVALVRARSLGADEALPRSVFFRRLPDLMPERA